VLNAGAFALREQSAYGQGSSFAGIAAGGALSSMYWNPAAITQFNGKTVEQVIRVQYVHVNRMAERNLTAIQRWSYDEKEKRWFLVKGFPDFR